MTPATTFALIGAGRVATALGVLLQRAGHRIVAASGRSASAERVRRYLPDTRFAPAPEAARAAAVVVLGVVDDAIEPTCA
ncbi:MAG: NAD(P)-binding domain-containing protein, partial [Actinobacteria bacterium]|nr:NAD(P)-binding domain-containing protein [Actinomycetota bacterium]